MADELRWAGVLGQTGLTVVARVFDTAGTQVAGDVSCPETTTAAYYVADFPVSVTTPGDYLVRYFSEELDDQSQIVYILVAQENLEWTGTAEATNLYLAALIQNIDFSTVPAGVWAYLLEGSFTANDFMRIILASAANKLSGAKTETIEIRDIADTKNRIVASVDLIGNRLTVTFDPS